MITAILNGNKAQPETFSPESATHCGLKKGAEDKYYGSYTLIDVDTYPYTKARRFANGHIVYLAL